MTSQHSSILNRIYHFKIFKKYFLQIFDLSHYIKHILELFLIVYETKSILLYIIIIKDCIILFYFRCLLPSNLYQTRHTLPNAVVLAVGRPVTTTPDWPRFAATRPRLYRRQGYEKSRRHINHAHKIRPFAHDSSQSIDHDNTRVVTRTSVEKPRQTDNHGKSMNETEIIVNMHASGLYAVNRITFID